MSQATYKGIIREVKAYDNFKIVSTCGYNVKRFDYNFLPKYGKSLEITNAFKNLISALKPVWNHNARFLERSFKTLIRSLTKIRSIDNLKCLHDIYYYLSYFGYDFMNRLYVR